MVCFLSYFSSNVCRIFCSGLLFTLVIGNLYLFYFLVYLARDLSVLLIVSKTSFDFIDFAYSSLFNFIDFHPNYYFLSAVWFAFFFALLIFFFNYLFYFWLHLVFVALWGLSLVAASRGFTSLQCEGCSLQWHLLFQNTGSRCLGFSSCGTWA